MKGGPTDFHYITPEDFLKENPDSKHTLKYLKKLARNRGTCENCDLPIWKFADTGMCFPCTTGESDASDDYELI